MKNIHFHSESEHHLNGKAQPMELHIVHQSLDKEILVVGAFIEVGPTTNLFFKELFDAKLPKIAGAESVIPLLQFDTLLDSFKGLGNIYSYEGSLTTPPCSEGVHWIFSQERPMMTQEDIQIIRDYLPPSSARPIQRSSSIVNNSRGSVILVSLLAILFKKKK